MRLLLSVLVFAACASAQSMPVPASRLLLPGPASMPPSSSATPDGMQQLVTFKDSEIKFSLQSLMGILRDHQHEGWVLAAYPDPNTGRPLIGAGFSLDVSAVDHPQPDALNPHSFVEPSSAQLWQAAGLPPQKLQQILEQFQQHQNAWTSEQYRRKVLRQRLAPQLSETEATQLLRISAIQAIYNARAYCRCFDRLTGSQQMALTQLVFQMGTNLPQFVEFLGAINDENGDRELAKLDGYMETESQHWQTVQGALMDSQWARRYSIRASTVIAMFDPNYNQQPGAAQQRVEAVLRLPLPRMVKSHPVAALRMASYGKHSTKSHAKRAVHSQIKRKLT